MPSEEHTDYLLPEGRGLKKEEETKEGLGRHWSIQDNKTGLPEVTRHPSSPGAQRPKWRMEK